MQLMFTGKKQQNPCCTRVLEVPGAGIEPALPQWQQDFKSFAQNHVNHTKSALSEF
jgi:hypothetical protein